MPLPAGRDDDLELTTAVDVVELHQLDQANGFTGIVLADEAAFALVVHVAVVELRELGKSLVRFFEPVAHDLRVVVQFVHEAQVIALQWAQGKVAGFFNHHDVVLVVLRDRKSTRLNSSHVRSSYAVFCLKKKNSTTYCY